MLVDTDRVKVIRVGLPRITALILTSASSDNQHIALKIYFTVYVLYVLEKNILGKWFLNRLSYSTM